MVKNENFIMQAKESKTLQELNLTDDFLFDVTTEELENCKAIIELTTGLRLKSLKWKSGQKVIHNLPGKRGVRLDFIAESEDGRIFDVEMQNRNEGNIPKRTRFYQALIDAPILKSGERGFDKMNPLYIIIICNYDPYGKKKYCYTFDNQCKEVPGLRLGDEVTKLLLSTKGENEEEVSKELVDFLHYVTESNENGLPDECDERLKRLHESIREIKASADMEVEYMKMEERERIIRDEGKQIGIINGKIESVLELLEDKGEVPEKVKAEIFAETDPEVLKKWLRLAAKSETIEEFCKEIDH
ncbi:Rpn family recombination-promoting nuclease/putative transposase [Dorea formicigenerans]|uniref:Rpn family recombination-promoting nuclease/putative transposase n=1 Tax=Dorea formicigenerans TaxID=39486 RepID=A0A3E4M7P0_9FIRM|nr:Rpn family recombination-promoting nuclease/putative transposase [Dorea formicigenerans]RGK45485.1 Rpn family recombination-promoting nuclease/putative transposase [Dorea formicigenerans]